MIGGLIISYLILGLICGSISMNIGETKGYTKGFWWGFWLLFMGIIVQAIRPYKETNYLKSTNQVKATYTEGKYGKCWQCSEELILVNDHVECSEHGRDCFNPDSKETNRQYGGKCSRCNTFLVQVNDHVECPIHGKDYIKIKW